MKDYLSSTDRDQFICFVHLINIASSIIDKTNTYTKEEITNFKKAFTWGSKVWDQVTKRLNPSAKKTLANMMYSTRVFLDYQSLTKVYAERKMSEINAAYEENGDYYKLVELILNYNCQGCTKHHNECDFYKEFEEQHLPNFDGCKPYGPCKYSFTSEE